jgi:hypothetical protein
MPARIVPPPPLQTARAQAERKRRTAAKHEERAVQLRSEAEALETRWSEYLAGVEVGRRSA